MTWQPIETALQGVWICCGKRVPWGHFLAGDTMIPATHWRNHRQPDALNARMQHRA